MLALFVAAIPLITVASADEQQEPQAAVETNDVSADAAASVEVAANLVGKVAAAAPVSDEL